MQKIKVMWRCLYCQCMNDPLFKRCDNCARLKPANTTPVQLDLDFGENPKGNRRLDKILKG